MPGCQQDLGVAQVLEGADLPPVLKRREDQCVEREPDSYPHQHPPGGVDHDVALGTHQASFEDHQQVSDHGGGYADPQRREATQPDRAPLALVVADALVAVAAQRHAEPTAQVVVDLRGRQRELEPDRPPHAPRANQAEAVLDSGEEVTVLGEQVGLGQVEHLLSPLEPQLDVLPLPPVHRTTVSHQVNNDTVTPPDGDPVYLLRRGSDVATVMFAASWKSVLT